MSNPFVQVLLNLLMNPIVIGGIVLVIAFLFKGRKSKKERKREMYATSRLEASEEEPAESESTASTSRGTSKIFINGGVPASGNTMGKITVGTKSMTLLYTDAPIEITIPAGRHHVVVEGGVCGDARIDRFMDFGVLDVWTLDMPGGDDADVIRHQMIGYSEYRQALSDFGYRPTRKEL